MKTKQSRIKILGIAFVVLTVSIGVVAGLVAASGILRDTRGTFLRMLPPHPVEELDSINMGSDSYYFAGTDEEAVYLAKYRNPFHLLKVCVPSLDTQHVSLNYINVHRQKYYSPKVKVLDDHFIMTDGSVAEIFDGNLTERVGVSLECDSIFFRDIQPISKSSYMLKSLNGKRENMLAKFSIAEPHWLSSSTILVKQKDGIFCSDGTMSFNRQHNKILFTYFYRNQFTVVDTSLNIVYRGNTIDTVSVAKIVPTKMKDDGSSTLASPQYLVNRLSRTDGRWIFIQSELPAKNEHRDALKQGCVIDVYDFTTGKYSLSFYVYNYKGSKRMNEFVVVGDRMIVRYGNLLRALRLKPEFFDPFDQ